MSQEAELQPAVPSRGRAAPVAPVAPTVQESAGAGLSSLHLKPQRSLWGNAWRQFRRHKLAMAGLIVFSIFIVATLVGTVVWPYEVNDPYAFMENVVGEPPTLSHPMGTDDQGQDILARVLWGGRISIAVGLIAAAVAILVGTAVGAIAGFFGGFTDSALMRITDMFISLPQLPLLLLITFLFRDPIVAYFDRQFDMGNLGVFVLIVLVIGLLSWMPTARLVRASFLGTKEREFVEAARSMGATRPSLIFKHILPNVLSPIIVAATLGVGAAIITESSLSFLGLGFPSDVPTWGRLLFDAALFLDLYPHQALFPGAMIFLTVLAINYMGDGLRDALDPRKTQ